MIRSFSVVDIRDQIQTAYEMGWNDTVFWYRDRPDVLAQIRSGRHRFALSTFRYIEGCRNAAVALTGPVFPGYKGPDRVRDELERLTGLSPS